jgi:hypothetical protein
MTDPIINPEHTLLNFQKSRPANPVERQKAKEIMKEYPYELVLERIHFLKKDIFEQFTPTINRFNVEYIGATLKYLPYSGYYTYEDITFYYSDEYKSGKSYMFFKTLNDLERMNKFFEAPIKTSQPNSNLCI